MKQGSWKREWDKGEVTSEFWYRVAQSVTTDFILPLMPNYPISNLLLSTPKGLLLQHLCLYHIGNPIFF